MTFHRQAFREGPTRRARAVHTAVCRCIGECGKHEIACADRAFGAQFESRRDDVAAPHDRYISRRALRRPDTVRLSVNNARNRSVPAIYHAVFASMSSAIHRKDHLIHYRSQKTHRKPRLTTSSAQHYRSEGSNIVWSKRRRAGHALASRRHTALIDVIVTAPRGFV